MPTTIIKIKYAWLPTKMSNGIWIWFKEYRFFKETTFQQTLINGVWTRLGTDGEDKWVTIEKTVL